MQRVLITGMSGTGKSTVIQALAARGYQAVDADCAECSHWVAVSSSADIPGSPVEPERDWVWREDRIQELLSSANADILFLSGCAPNMGKFLSQFEHVVLLSAPAAIIVERLRTRSNNLYGKQPAEVTRVLSLLETVEPLLRKVASHEIDTSAALDDVVATILQIVQTEG